ncbi:unnamed protein product [Closterium sp. NIES-54]
MDERLVQDWTTQVLVPFLKQLRDEGGRRKQAFLVFDSYKGHLTESVGQTLKMFKVMRAVIPGGCTPLVQPLDVSINRSFKCGVHHHHSTWFEYVGIGQTTRAEELVKKPFLACGISSAEDGSEDHLILVRLRDKAEVEVLEDVLEEEDGAHPNPFYEDPSHAPESPTTKYDEVEDEEEGLAGEEGVVDAAARGPLSEGLGFESQCVHFGHPSAGGCQRSTGDPRLILGKGYKLVVLGGYGRTDLLLNKLFYPNGLVVGILTAVAEGGNGMAPNEEEGETGSEMGGVDEWSEDGDDWWEAGRYEGEEVEEWVAGEDDWLF